MYPREKKSGFDLQRHGSNTAPSPAIPPFHSSTQDLNKTRAFPPILPPKKNQGALILKNSHGGLIEVPLAPLRLSSIQT